MVADAGDSPVFETPRSNQMNRYVFVVWLIAYCLCGWLLLELAAGNLVTHRWQKQRLWWWGCGGLALLMMLSIWQLCDPYQYQLFIDFNKAYYPAGRLALENPSSLYEWAKIPPDSPAYRGRGMVNIPIIALLFAPLSRLNLPTAQLVLTGVGVLILLLTCYLFIQVTQVTGSKRLALIGLFLINGPLYYSLKIGNSTHFLLLPLLAALLCLHKKQQIWSGVLIAICALIKIPLLLLGVYLLLRQRWSALVGFVATLVAIAGASILLFGWDLHVDWFYSCIQPSIGKLLAAYNVQSIDGFLARLLIPGNNVMNFQFLEVGWEFKLIRYVLLSLLIGGTLLVLWRSKPPTSPEEQNLEFSIFLCLAVLTSPISWTHYFLFLLLPLGLYLGGKLAVPKGQAWLYCIAVATFLLSPPIMRDIARLQPENALLNFLVTRVLISHYFFGGLLLLGILLAARWQTAKRYLRLLASGTSS